MTSPTPPSLRSRNDERSLDNEQAGPPRPASTLSLSCWKSNADLDIFTRWPVATP